MAVHLGYRSGISVSVTPSSPVDPLSGFNWAARLQTHIPGSNTPIGLFQDVACTIPATQDGDPVAAWRDELSASGSIAAQIDTQKQPILAFQSGVPTLIFDGVDDGFVTSVALVSPWSIAMAGAVDVVAGSRMVQATLANRVLTFNRNDASAFLGSSVVDNTAINPGSTPSVSILTENTTARCVINGVDRTENSAFSGVSWGTIAIGFSGAFGEGFSGFMVAMLGLGSELTLSQCGTVNTYLTNLLP